MRAIAVALCLLGACADVTVLRYQPSKVVITAPERDHAVAIVARPARGEVAAATLADGFPVWVIHRDDGTVSVFSAVAPPQPKRTSYTPDNIASLIERRLVSWIPGTRRFKAGGILFDDRGRALGYADFDGCAGECWRIEDMPKMAQDLDTFRIRYSDTHVEVGARIPGRMRQRAASWLPWRRADKAARQQDMDASGAVAFPRLAFDRVRALVEGDYAIVDGKTVRSTHAAPMICAEPMNQCGECGADRLTLHGIPSADAAHIHSDGWWKDPADYRRSRRAVYVEAEPGTFLVRRESQGFAIVAGVFRGICSGSWGR